MASTVRIYLARHGETDWNRQQRLQGWTDIPLNERGEAQARALAGHLATESFDVVYCSSLGRSRATASPLSERAPLHVREDLREQGLGKFEGVRMDGSEPDLAAEFVRRIRDSEDRLDGGESRSDHWQRVEAAIDEIVAAHAGGAIVIVGHGGTNAVIARRLLGDAAAPYVHQANDALEVIDVHGPEQARLVAHIRFGVP